MAFAGERLSDDALGFRACINISGIDEIDAVVQCMVNDAGGCPLISPLPKAFVPRPSRETFSPLLPRRR